MSADRAARGPGRPQVLTRRGWVDLGGGRIPEVDELASIEMRGLPPGASVALGPVVHEADEQGRSSVRPAEEEDLACHLGFLPVFVDGEWAGEIDIRPGKVTYRSFHRLVHDLQTTWAGLVLGAGPTSVGAAGPDPRTLWNLLAGPLRDIQRAAPSRLALTTGRRHVHRVRRPAELTPSVLAAGMHGRPGRAVVVGREPDGHVLDFAADTLMRLAAYARNTAPSSGVADMATCVLRGPPFSGRRRSDGPVAVPHRVRHDRRLQPLLEVRRQLERPDAVPVEGPAELRLGVRAMDRLYEYWVLLQVLLAARRRYGEPVDGHFDDMAVRLPGPLLRLEIPAGTTITFPGEVHVAFEPRIGTDPQRSWEGLEYSPPPGEPGNVLTPDIVIYRRHEPLMVVIDAKYRVRHRIESAAIEVHAKYGRIRCNGAGIVHSVLVAHPHDGYEFSYAGYGARSFVPGGPAPRVPLPPTSQHRSPTPSSPPSPAAVPPKRPLGSRPMEWPDDAIVTVIADQRWMHRHLGSRRIDLRDLRRLAAGDRPSDPWMIAPEIPALAGFITAARNRGWQVHTTPTVDRHDQLDIAAEIAEGLEHVCVVSGDDEFIAAVRRACRGTVAVIDDLGDLAPLR